LALAATLGACGSDEAPLSDEVEDPSDEGAEPSEDEPEPEEDRIRHERVEPSGTTGHVNEPEPIEPEPVDPLAGTLRLVPASALIQHTEAGARVEAPRVRVLSAEDEPLEGVEVQFTAVGDGGMVAQQSARSDVDGYASAATWQVGKLVGDYKVSASAPELESVAAVQFVAEAQSAFHIELVFTREPTPTQFAVFEAARRRWEGIVLNALPPVSGNLADFAATCGYTVDDEWYESDGLTIFVELERIDGPSKVLGRAGPCLLRGSDGSPAFGGMTLDTDDLAVLETHGYLEGVVLHEMGHVLGIGTVWAQAGLLAEPSLPDHRGADTHFTGDSAGVAFEELLAGAEYHGGKIVPVANEAIWGSSDGHWREDVLRSELMTPVLTGREPSLPLSLLTIASLQDLGFYETNLKVADPFSIPSKRDIVLASHAAEEPLASGCELVSPHGILVDDTI